MSEEYERYSLDIAKYILIALQILGGNASRQEIKEKLVEDTQFDLTYHEVFEPYNCFLQNYWYICKMDMAL